MSSTNLSKYEVVYSNGMSFEYESYSDAIEAMSVVANKMQEFATEVRELNASGEATVLYRPEYSVKLVWTEITEVGRQSI